METTTVYDYAEPVHRVLMEPNVVMGIGIMPAVFLMVLTIVLMNTVSVWCLAIGIALYMVAKRICKKDPYMLQILFERLSFPDRWRV